MSWQNFLFGCALLTVGSVEGALKWEKDLVFLSSAPGEGKAVGHFGFTNTGNYPIKIEGFKTSCGCTAATAEKRLIGPGEHGEVLVTYNTAGRRGLKEAPVIVKTDDPGAAESVLRLRVLIQEVLEVQPTLLFWSEGEGAEAKKISVKVSEGFEVKEVKAACTEAGLKVRLETLKSGREYVLWVTPPASGGLKAKIEMSSDYAGENVKPTIVHVRVR